MRVVTLVEDRLSEEQKNRGLNTEHGLSFYVETGKYSFLFDVGMSDLYRVNADKLGVEVTKAEFLVLSHGHYDHGGGLADFLENATESVPVYLRGEAFGDYFSHRKTGLKYIGLEQELKEKYQTRLAYTEDLYRINEEVSVFTVARDDKGYKDKFPAANTVLKKLSEDGEYVGDDFLHEQNLVVESDGKLILMSACSHCGIVNIMEQFVGIYGRRPDVVVGGLHLTNPQTLECEPEDRLLRLAEYFLQGNTRYYIGHCTGDAAFGYLKSKLGDRIERISTGTMIEI